MRPWMPCRFPISSFSIINWSFRSAGQGKCNQCQKSRVYICQQCDPPYELVRKTAQVRPKVFIHFISLVLGLCWTRWPRSSYLLSRRRTYAWVPRRLSQMLRLSTSDQRRYDTMYWLCTSESICVLIRTSLQPYSVYLRVTNSDPYSFFHQLVQKMRE